MIVFSIRTILVTRTIQGIRTTRVMAMGTDMVMEMDMDIQITRPTSTTPKFPGATCTLMDQVPATCTLHMQALSIQPTPSTPRTTIVTWIRTAQAAVFLTQVRDTLTVAIIRILTLTNLQQLKLLLYKRA